MDLNDLDIILASLRATHGETTYLEVKAAEADLPDNLHETMSAFANTAGGLILLGVVEGSSEFRVAGVSDPQRVVGQLRDMCSRMVPILRPLVDRIAHPDGLVISVEIQSIDRRQRPCYLEEKGPFGGSYIRLDEGDVLLAHDDVASLLAERSTDDASRNPAPAGTSLDPTAVNAFINETRISSSRWTSVSDDELLRSRQVLADGQPTIAGSMALSFDPDKTIPAARITYRVEPPASAPRGARFTGEILTGPIGVLLDDVLDRLRADLPRITVSSEAGTEDVHEVPIRSLREVISNSLVHRSYTDAQLEKPVFVHVTDRAVSVVSPGSCYVDVEKLGLGTLTNVRNYALVAICQRVSTPSGQRICEAQVTGIRYADEISREVGAWPPLFLDRALEFEVLLMRRPLELAEATEWLPDTADAIDRRLIAWAMHAQRLGDDSRELHEAALLTAVMAARLMAPSSLEDGVARLVRLEERGFLARRRDGRRTHWVATREATIQREIVRTPKRDRIRKVTLAVHELGGEATPAEIATALGLGSTRTRSQWIADAAEAELVEVVANSTYDPNKVVRLTRNGRAVAVAASRTPPSGR